jgi:hypothetical protein
MVSINWENVFVNSIHGGSSGVLVIRFKRTLQCYVGFHIARIFAALQMFV